VQESSAPPDLAWHEYPALPPHPYEWPGPSTGSSALAPHSTCQSHYHTHVGPDASHHKTREKHHLDTQNYTPSKHRSSS
jgi:hypothetical protein